MNDKIEPTNSLENESTVNATPYNPQKEEAQASAPSTYEKTEFPSEKTHLDVSSLGEAGLPKYQAQSELPDDSVNSSRGDRGSTQVTTGNIKADVTNVIGKINVKQKDEEKIKLHSVPPSIIEKTVEVFVAPPDFNTLVSRLASQIQELWPRIFLITGPERCGKLTCAIQLGLELLNTKPDNYTEHIKLYQRTERETRSLIDFAQHKELPHSTVYIIQDAFKNGVLLEELESTYLAVLSNQLKTKRAFLIITAATQDNLDILSINIGLYEQQSLLEVLNKHLLRYKSGDEDLSLHPDVVHMVHTMSDGDTEFGGRTLVSHFKFPPEIDRFCRVLCDLPSDATIDDIINYADRIQQTTHRSARGWFIKDLSPNEQLYAMLAFLFQGVPRNILEDLYTSAVNHLREDGLVDFDDPRIFGLDDILNRINAEKTEEGVIQFQTQAFEQEVEKQIKNYHHLLWSLISFIVELVENYSGPEYWVFRRDLGTAIGRLGIYRKRDLNTVLYYLARHSSGGVVAVAGSALGEICQQYPDEQDYVLEILRTWRESGDFDLMWAFSVCIWRVFEGLTRAKYRGRDHTLFLQKREETISNIVEQLYIFASHVDDFNEQTRLKALIIALGLKDENEKITLANLVSKETALRMENQLNSWAIQNFDALLHAVRQMYLSAPDSVVKLIERWLVNVDEFKSQLAGQFASLHLFSMHENPSQLIMRRHKPLLRLLDRIFSSPEILENELNRTVALALQNWLAIETDDPTIRDEISLKLIEIADRAETQETENLSVLLDFWIESSVSIVNELARLLNNRIHVMSGFPVEKAGGRYGIIIFDSSYIAGLDKKAARCVRDILDSLEPQIDLYTMRMGEKQIVASPNEVVSTSRLHTKRVLPRLIYPTLEMFPRDLTQADFILLLTWGEILDIDDIPDEWAEKAILAFSDTDKQAKKIWSRDENVVVFDGNKSTRPIKEHIQIRIAQTLANIKNAIETEIELLVSLFEQLRLRNLSSSQEDPARRIMYLVQIQASNDLVFTVNQLISWFETDRNDIRHYIARASARMLFRLFGSVVPVPSVKTHDILLSLVPILANENSPWASGKIILTALRNWALGDSQWMVRVFSHPHGRSVELFSLVDKLTKTHGKQVKTLLKTWEEVDSPPESLFKFTERIRLRLEIGQKRSLPELSDSRQFVVIIYDASTQQQVYKQRLARIVSKLLTELNHKHEARMFTLTYRFGFDQIIAEGNQKIEPDQLMSDNMRYSPILGPILEIHKPESVACVLVLTAGRIIDHRDWQNSVWTDRLLVYDDSSTNPRWAEPYSIIAAEKNESDAINQIMNRIEERVGV